MKTVLSMALLWAVAVQTCYGQGELSATGLKEGARGTPTWIDAKVMQVIDDGQMLVGIEDARTGDGRYSTWVMVKCPTKGITDGKFWRGGSWEKVTGSNVLNVTGTTTYKTAIGGTKTVFVVEPMSKKELDELAAKERERREADDPKNQIENAKKRFWIEQPKDAKIVAGERASVNGEWWNGVEGEGRQTMTIVQSSKGNGITVTCSYRLPNGEQVRWRFAGTISEEGHITGRLFHTKAPKGFANQSWIAVVSRDGKTITGRAIFDTAGGHDFVWTRLEQPK